MATAPSLGRSAAQGALYVGIGQATRAALMIGTTIVVARILSPTDYGVMAMAAPILAFVLLFQDLGFSAATVQARQISSEQSTVLFWINVAASLLVATVMILLSPFVARFYGDARVGYVTAASALPVVLSSFGIQQLALLTRSMRFRTISMIVIWSGIASAAVTIAAALWLRNYWALYLGTLTASSVQLCLTWANSEWRPGRRMAWAEANSLVRFGSYLVAFDLLNFFSRNVDSVLIGRVFGAGPVGLYERSQRLMLAPLQLINAPLARVMLPVLSQLRDEPERYRAAYLFALRALMLLAIPAAAVAASASDAVILVLLGPAWKKASPIFFWLAIAALYQPVANSTGWLFQSAGRGKAFAQWGMVSSVATVASFFAGLPWGVSGVAAAYVLIGLVLMPILLSWATRDTPVRSAAIVSAAMPFAAAGVGTWLALKVLGRFLPPLPLIVCGLILSYALVLLVLCASTSGREFLLRLCLIGKSVAADIRPRRSDRQSGSAAEKP